MQLKLILGISWYDFVICTVCKDLGRAKTRDNVNVKLMFWIWRWIGNLNKKITVQYDMPFIEPFSRTQRKCVVIRNFILISNTLWYPAVTACMKPGVAFINLMSLPSWLLILFIISKSKRKRIDNSWCVVRCFIAFDPIVVLSKLITCWCHSLWN